MFDDPPSMHGRVARSALVARVRFVSVDPVGVRDTVLRDGYTYRAGYVAALEYTFRVNEYLKGTGGAEITALAFGSIMPEYDGRVTHSTEAGAREKARALLAIRDNRWEGREGIVFLRQFAPGDRYVLDYFDLDRPPHTNNVSVSDNDFKAWLPAVNEPATSTDRMRTASAGEQLYFVEDPYDVRVTTSGGAGGARGASGGSRIIRLSPGRVTEELEALTSGGSGNSNDEYGRSSADSSIVVLPPETVTLSGIRSVIAELDRQLRESGNSEEAKRCLAETWWFRENGRFGPYDSYAPNIGSGQVTGGFYINRYLDPELRQRLAGTPNDESFSWFGGPDAHRFEYVDPGLVVPARPLPAGQYRIFYNEQGYDWGRLRLLPGGVAGHRGVPRCRRRPRGQAGRVVFRPLHGRERRHRHDHCGHHLVAGGPSYRGSDHRRYRPRPRLHRPGRHDHAVVDRRRLHGGWRDVDVDGGHAALERGGQADAARPQARRPHAHACPHTYSYAYSHAGSYAYSDTHPYAYPWAIVSGDRDAEPPGGG